MTAGADPLEDLFARIRACRVCADRLEPRPVIRGAASAKVRIVGQAPGTRVHASGMPFTDPSGDRLRDWLGVDEATFYDEHRIAITPMGFCFPGLDAKGGDKPPDRRCAPLWQNEVTARFPNVELTLLVGRHAQQFHLGKRAYPTLTETVRHWRDYLPDMLPLPHPSWRNNVWLKKHPWFENEVLPMLRCRMQKLLQR
ncbi:MAG: uracil-DNA glycosylase [Maricaulis sp.]|jgi:uracil-DNA glycosylase family 4|nr:uracil-DNA glycosylase [Maricaulis sp.]